MCQLPILSNNYHKKGGFIVNIFILEDELMQQQRLERLIQGILTKNKWKATSITITARPNSLLELAAKSQGKNIYFLDIEIKKMQKKGLEVAQSIRQFDPYGIIVFITTHAEFAPITYNYKVSALDFIDKNADEKDFEKQVTECLSLLFDAQKQLVSEDAFIFKNQHSHFQIPFYDILYFETSDIAHKIQLVGKSKRLEFYGTLEEVEALDHRLFRCHRSFVINIANVEQIDRSEHFVYFQGGHRTLISRRKIKKTIELMQKEMHEK